MAERMSFDQSEEENKKAFVDRLVKAGWDKKEAEEEWERTQEECESEF